MTKNQLTLYISSGAHLTRPKTRIEKIENALEHVEVVFVEAPRSHPPRLKTRLVNFVMAPMTVTGLYIWVAFLNLVAKISSIDDLEIVKHLERKYDADIVLTDYNIHDLLAKSRFSWALGHYIILILSVMALPFYLSTQLQSLSLYGRVISLFVIVSFTQFLLLTAGTLPARDLQIAKKIDEYAKENQITQGCLIIGKAHEPGVVSELKQSEYVEVYSSEDS